MPLKGKVPRHFRKLAPNYTPCQIAQVFEKSLKFSQASLHINGLVIPEPISYNSNSILFEHINIGRLLIDEYRIGPNWDTVVLERIGRYLGALHSLKSKNAENTMVLGDLCPGNISISGDDICFFDFEPPPNLHYDFQKFYTNSFYLDLASFILWMWIVHPLRKPHLYFKSQDTYIRRFLKGYNTEAGREINQHRLAFFLKSAIRDRSRVIRAQSVPAGLHKTCLLFILELAGSYHLQRLSNGRFDI